MRNLVLSVILILAVLAFSCSYDFNFTVDHAGANISVVIDSIIQNENEFTIKRMTVENKGFLSTVKQNVLVYASHDDVVGNEDDVEVLEVIITTETVENYILFSEKLVLDVSSDDYEDKLSFKYWSAIQSGVRFYAVYDIDKTKKDLDYNNNTFVYPTAFDVPDDTEAPLATSGNINAYYDVDNNTIDISFTKSIDNCTKDDDIVYKIYYSTEYNIDATDDCRTYGAVFFEGKYSSDLFIDSLIKDEVYYLNVSATDRAGNEIFYNGSSARVPSYSSEKDYFLGMVIDNAGTEHVVYYSGNFNSVCYISKTNSGNWSSYYELGDSDYYISDVYGDMKYDATNDVVHVFYTRKINYLILFITQH